jgi:valyl-tRNA synthetase
VNALSLELTDKTIAEAIPAVAGKEKFYLVTSSPIDMGSQKQELMKELEYLKGFLISVEKKLSNEKFVQNAKAEVVDIEKKKKADAEMKIRMIEESLTNLN